MDQREIMVWHLRYNHYPPVSVEYVDVAFAAIDAIRDEDPERWITLPGDPERAIQAWQIVEGLHLDAWCEPDYEEIEA